MLHRFHSVLFLASLALVLAFVSGCAQPTPYQQLMRGEYDRAAFEYAHRLRINPDDQRSAVFLGYAYYKGGHYDMAYTQLMPLVELNRVAGFASFWAGLAALRMENSQKLVEAWSRWKKMHGMDYETLKVFREFQAELTNRDLTGLAFLAEEIERCMNDAYALDEYARNSISRRGPSGFSEERYAGLARLAPVPYLP